MDENLKKIYKKYYNTLSKYDYTEDYNDIIENSDVIFINKNTSKKKFGIFKKYKDNSIIELSSKNIKKFYIYTDENYIFYKNKESSLKDILTDLINNNFLINKK
jgi:hypothetical protein